MDPFRLPPRGKGVDGGLPTEVLSDTFSDGGGADGREGEGEDGGGVETGLAVMVVSLLLNDERIRFFMAQQEISNVAPSKEEQIVVIGENVRLRGALKMVGGVELSKG